MRQIATASLKQLTILLDSWNQQKLFLSFIVRCCEKHDGCRCNTKISVSKAVSCNMCSTFIAQLCYEGQILLEDVDQLNAKVKSATGENKIRQAKFTTVGCPPQSVVTRWRSWLNVALYYAKNSPKVKAKVESFKESNTIVTKAKVSLQATGLATQLLKIKDQYESLVNLIETMESAKNTIKETEQPIKELDFGEDTCCINCYI